MIRAIALWVTVLTGLALLNPQTGYACSCADEGDAVSAMKQSAAVFTGTVLALRPAVHFLKTDPRVFGDEIQAVMKVDRVWKGITDSQVLIRTSSQDSACAFPFKEGERYLIYAYGAKFHLETSKCSRSRTASRAGKEIEDLGHPLSLRLKAVSLPELKPMKALPGSPSLQRQIVGRWSGTDITRKRLDVEPTSASGGFVYFWLEGFGLSATKYKITGPHTLHLVEGRPQFRQLPEIVVTITLQGPQMTWTWTQFEGQNHHEVTYHYLKDSDPGNKAMRAQNL